MKNIGFILCNFLILTSLSQSAVFGIGLSLLCNDKGVIFDVNLISPKINKSFKTNNKGVLEIKHLSYDEKYKLILSHKNYVTKSIVIDATNSLFDGKIKNELIELEVEMVFKNDFIDYGVITQSPVGKIEMIQKSGAFENDKSYGLLRKKEIDAFLLSVENESKKNEGKFKKLIKETKLYMEDGQLKAAEISLALAENVSVNKETELARNRLFFVKKNKTEEGDAIVKIQKVADSLFEKKEYDKSISLFKRIIRLDPGNSYAEAKILDINILMVNLEKPSSEVAVKRTSTAEIIFKAKSIQDKRIEKNRNYYANRKAP